MKHHRHLLACVLVLTAGSLLPLRAADEMIPLEFSTATMDKSVDPRVDFSQYAWGGWAARTEIPADKSRWGAADMLGENNWRRIRGILEEAAAHPAAAGTSARKVGDFYASAIDEAAIES